MGLQYNFICPSCNYSATVEGKEGHGFIVSVKTFQCNDCNSLVDIVMEDRSQIPSDAFEGIPGGVIIKNNNPTCPICNSANISLWKGSKPDCPKCNTPMGVGRSRVFWD
jgi:rubrerythrin